MSGIAMGVEDALDRALQRQRQAFLRDGHPGADVRIERLMKDKYPGTRRDFFLGYKEIVDSDLFEFSKMDMNKAGSLTRINLHLKWGIPGFLTVNLDEVEQDVVREILEVETFEGVIALAKRLCKSDHKPIQDDVQRLEKQFAGGAGDDDADKTDEVQGDPIKGLMDLGATVCTRSRPQCLLCPVQSLCVAQAQGDPTRFPVKTRKVARRHEVWSLLVLQRENDGAIWFSQRAATGIWAGLWTPPVSDGERWSGPGEQAWSDAEQGPAVVHQLTHRELRLHPWRLTVPAAAPARHGLSGQWHSRADWAARGLPAPVRRYLESLDSAAA